MVERATPSEKLVFDHAVEAMFLRALKDRLPFAARSRLAGAGLDLAKPLLPAYPLATWMRCLRIAAEEVFEAVPLEAGLRQLGELLVDAYAETAIGRAMFGLARVIGPRRTLTRATQNFRSGNNYSQT